MTHEIAGQQTSWLMVHGRGVWSTHVQCCKQADGSSLRDDSKSIAESADGSNYRDDERSDSEMADGSSLRDDSRGI